jgi:hypothetical protein
MFQTKVVEKNQNPHCTFNHFFLKKSCCLLGDLEKYGRNRQATGDKKMLHRKYAICMLDN